MLIAAITLAGIGKVFLFLVMLSVLITLHEYGHFLVARRNGVRVNEFSIGMGPQLFGWTSPQKRHAVLAARAADRRLLRDAGRGQQDQRGRAAARVPRSCRRTRRRQLPSQDVPGSVWPSCWRGRSPTSSLLSSSCSSVRSSFGVASDGAQPVIGMVVKDSPADAAGLRSGDRSVAIDGKQVTNGKTLIDTIHGSLGKSLNVSYARDGADATVTVVPKPCPAPSRRNGAASASRRCPRSSASASEKPSSPAAISS